MAKTKTQPVDGWSAEVYIPAGGITLRGELSLPVKARGVVLFAQGDDSRRHSPGSQWVARVIRSFGIGTLLVDLLTMEENGVDAYSRHMRFDIGLLAERLVDAGNWLKESAEWIGDQAHPEHLRMGYFGASIGGGAALVAAAVLGDRVGAVVSSGGRPDLAGAALVEVRSPTMLIVGGRDETVLVLNFESYSKMDCEKDMQIVSGATHMLEEPDALSETARLAAGWFWRHLQP
jgi:putative phosphoribosyl transferase